MTTIFGIDCATQAHKVGITKARWENGQAIVEEMLPGEDHWQNKIAGWISQEDQVLLALDAPLGWPELMGRWLADHEAGDPVGKAEKMKYFFSRHTDRRIKEEFESNPLEVGANLIARTAYKALDDLRLIGKDIPVKTEEAGEKALTEKASAIEVYPAATLEAHEINNSGYKSGEDAEENRKEMISNLPETIDINDRHQQKMIGSDHLLDSLICVLAGVDYLKGDVIRPEKEDVVKKEGWIWVKPKN